MLIPLDEHTLVVFWLQLALLVPVARGLGGLLRRAGQPRVVGELAAGVLLGPSVLGRLFPGLSEMIFPADEVQSAALLALSTVGVALLLVVTGFETDLKLLRSLGRPAATVSVGSFLVPLVLGTVLGLGLPEVFRGDASGPVTFPLLIGVAFAVSALPVVATILLDMGLMRRNFAQVTLASGTIIDVVGIVMLGAIAGIVIEGGLDPVRLGIELSVLVAFGVAALTIGQRAVDRALRAALKGDRGHTRTVTVALVLTVIFGAITQLIGVEALVGALVAGILLGRSRFQPEESTHTIEVITATFFAPLFFATAGLSVDFGLLADPVILGWTTLAVVVATLAKLVGSWAGALAGALDSRSGVAVGLGLNARGATGIVVASIGLSVGALNVESFTLVVVVAILTSVLAPPTLRWALARLREEPEETRRLEREMTLERSVIAGVQSALLPTRGGSNSVLAGRLLDLAMQPETTFTVLTVHPPGDEDAMQRQEPAVRALDRILGARPHERHDRAADDSVQVILEEASLGYGLVALGMSEDFKGGHAMSGTLRTLLAQMPCPLLLLRHGEGVDPNAELPFRRILVGAPGTATGKAAQEIAYVIAGRLDARVDVVHVVNRPDKEPVAAVAEGANVAVGTLEQAERLAARYGREVNVETRAATAVGPELAAAAQQLGSDLIVLSAQLRNLDGQPFLGHGIEYILEHTSTTLAILLFPADQEE